LADASYDSGQSASYDSQQADVGFDGSYQDSGSGYTGFGGNNYSYSGGGDVDFSVNDTTGAYDSDGGSFDFGGSDFGGSGFDSGGGDFGF